jgi:putative endonuclease
MTKQRIQKGRQGESVAVSWLTCHGYKILEQNYRTFLGEIDVIARQDQTICFIEVKTRFSRSKGSGLEAVTVKKQYKISQNALMYLKAHQKLSHSARFDVILVETDPLGHHQVTLIQDAFPLASPYSY